MGKKKTTKKKVPQWKKIGDRRMKLWATYKDKEFALASARRRRNVYKKRARVVKVSADRYAVYYR